jgi:hypothetical protein
MLNRIRNFAWFIDQLILNTIATVTGTPHVPQYIQYDHHGTTVWVREDLKGTHRQYCLCWSCANLKPGSAENCPIAQKLYELDVEHHLTTPVFECPEFKETS